MTDPKRMLLHSDNSRTAKQRIGVACQLADAFDAEVVAQYCALPEIHRRPLALVDWRRLDAARTAVQVASQNSPRLKWCETLGEPMFDFMQQALYADLLILGQRDPGDPAAAELPPDFVPALLIDSGRPALVLPYIGPPAVIGRNVLVAWKATRASARAVAAALPWLRRAHAVHVVTYGDPAEVDAGLRAIAGHLRTHGVAARLHHGGPEPTDTGAILLSLAADIEADLLVLGCYGHSRARERVFGGVTRSLLESMTLPLLMTH